MSDALKTKEEDAAAQAVDAYSPDLSEQEAITEVLNTFNVNRQVMTYGYNYFQGRQLTQVIDDWTKRWNGYIPPLSPLLDSTQSNIFINFTRNMIISYLSKVAMQPVTARIVAVNKKQGTTNKKFAELLEDLNVYSLRAENSDKKFLEMALECTVKGTVVVYEGYMKEIQKMKSPIKFDQTTGKIEWKEEDRVVFDNCYQEVVSLEDFYISNPYQPDVQKQPKIIWRRITTRSEAEAEFGHYSNFKYVKGGVYNVAGALSTFYQQQTLTTLTETQVEIMRYYCRYTNRHIVLINGVIIYDGPIPFKDGKYPFAKAINEPFAVNFFWGNGHPNKYMGEQDLINTFINAMADKTINSLLPTGLSSDPDDMIEDDVMEIGKFRKVGDIEKWKWWEAPAVNSGEMNMFQTVMGLARESGSTDAGSSFTSNGGRIQTRQILIQQQELMNKVAYNMNFIEDLERDRTELRVSHILQFYSIPRIEKITGVDGAELKNLTYRDVQLSGTKLSNGKTGNKLIKLIDNTDIATPDARRKLEDNLSVTEVKGEMLGTPTEALALSVDMFIDYNHSVQVVRASSYKKNEALEQAKRMEFANWRLQAAPIIPIPNPEGFVEWVEESFDIDTSKFEVPKGGGTGMPPGAPTAPPAGAPVAPGAPAAPAVPGAPGGANGGGAGAPTLLKNNAPTAAVGGAALGR